MAVSSSGNDPTGLQSLDQPIGRAGNDTIAIITGVQGDVFVIDGKKLKVTEGQELALGNTVLCEGSSAALVTLLTGQVFSLGHDQSVELNARFLELVNEILDEGSLEEGINFDLLAQALEDGGNLEELLPAPAAGGEQAAGAAGAAGTRAARVELTGATVTPESGFDTEGLSRQSTIEAPRDFEFPLTLGSDAPLELSFQDVALFQDEEFSLNLADYVTGGSGQEQLIFTVGDLPPGLSFDSTTSTIAGAATNAAAQLNNGLYGVSITVTAVDSRLDPVDDILTISVADVNDSPLAGGSVVFSNIAEDSLLTITEVSLISDAVDPDRDDLSVSNVRLLEGEGELVVGSDGGYVFNPAENWFGDVVIAYQLTDGVLFSGDTAATFSVTAVNDAPVAVGDGLILTEMNSAVTVDLLSNDYDVDGDELSISSATANVGEVVINANGSVTYIPPDDYIGRDLLSYAITDGNGAQSVSLALVNIRVGNLPPDLGADVDLEIAENTLELGQFFATDPDGDLLSYSLEGADAALFQIDSNQNIRFIAAADFEMPSDANSDGTYAITLVATDDGPLNLSDSQNITVTVTNVIENTAPSLGLDQSINLNEDESFVGNFSGSDLENDSLAYELSGADAALFSIDALGNLSFINIPSSDLDARSYNVTVNVIDDGEGALSDSQNLTVNVLAVNDLPVAETLPTQELVENFSSYSIDLTLLFSDEETADGDLVYSVSGNANIGVSIDANGIATITGAADWTGTENITFTATDAGGLSVDASADFVVSAYNEAPTTTGLADQNLTEDFASYTIDLKDIFADIETVDGDLVYSVAGNTNIGVAIDSNGIATITSTADWNGTENLTFTATDAGGLSVDAAADFVVGADNDAPTTTGLADQNLTEDFASYTIDLKDIFEDVETVDGDLAYSVSGNTNIGVSIDASGIATITNTPDWSGTENISFSAQDTGGLSVAANADWSVTAVADAPIVTFDQNLVNVANQNEIPPPASTGLVLSFYDDLNNQDRDAALQEGVIDPSSATSSVRVHTGFGDATDVVNTGTVQTDGSTVEIGIGDSYSITGLIYLEEGSSYRFSGYHDDSMRIELGGQTMLSTTGDSYGNYGLGHTITGTEFVAPAHGYYSLEVFVNNVSGIGQFSVNLSENAGDEKTLSSNNFSLYSNVSELLAAGGQFEGFVASSDNLDGGFFEQSINVGLSDTYIEISNIVVSLQDVDGSETLQSLVLSDIPVGATLIDGTNTFFSSNALTEVDLLVDGWNLDNIQILPPAEFVGEIILGLTATSVESSNGSTASTLENIQVVVTDANNAVGDLDDDLVGDLRVAYGTDADDVITMPVLSDVTFGATSESVFGDDDAFEFLFSNADSPIASVSINLLDGTWDPGNGGGSYGVEIGAQSAGLALTTNDFSFSDGDSVLTLDVSGQTISAGDSIQFGLDFDNVGPGNSNEAGLLADYAEFTVTLVNGDSQTVIVNNANDGDIDTAAAQATITASALIGKNGDDSLTGSLGDELIVGGLGDDTLFGAEGNDSLHGGLDNDIIFGDAGDDMLAGDAGDDFLSGGMGQDILFGGDGDDIFYWQSSDFVAGPVEEDVVVDFEVGVGGDILDLADILQGESADSLSLDGYLNFSTDGDDTRVEVDIDGNSSGTDFSILLQGVDLGALGNDQLILQQLLDQGNLQTD